MSRLGFKNMTEDSGKQAHPIAAGCACFDHFTDYPCNMVIVSKADCAARNDSYNIENVHERAIK
jgi:hypothetical protein